MSELRREVLPIPDVKHVGVTTFVATDPDTSYPADRAAAAAGGRAERPGDPARRRRVRRLERVRRPVRDADGRAAGGRRAEVHALPHHRAVLADARRAAVGAQPPRRGDGRDHRDGDLGARLQLAAPEHVRAAGGDAAAQRLLDGAVRQVPRGAGVRVQPDRPVRPLAASGGGFEYFYGFIGGENNQWYPALYERTTPVEPWGTPEEGYHLMADLADRAILWMRQQKSMAPDKPFFTYFAPGATHAPHHVPQGVDREVQGQVRPGLGRRAGGDVRAPEGARA